MKKPEHIHYEQIQKFHQRFLNKRMGLGQTLNFFDRLTSQLYNTLAEYNKTLEIDPSVVSYVGRNGTVWDCQIEEALANLPTPLSQRLNIIKATRKFRTSDETVQGVFLYGTGYYHLNLFNRLLTKMNKQPKGVRPCPHPPKVISDTGKPLVGIHAGIVYKGTAAENRDELTALEKALERF